MGGIAGVGGGLGPCHARAGCGCRGGSAGCGQDWTAALCCENISQEVTWRWGHRER